MEDFLMQHTIHSFLIRHSFHFASQKPGFTPPPFSNASNLLRFQKCLYLNPAVSTFQHFPRLPTEPVIFTALGLFVLFPFLVCVGQDEWKGENFACHFKCYNSSAL